ncbi:MAG: MBL fold metallo-hydrolase [Clostridia bacterium]|nr:MBL fold metallo-hydrolase [Clostridia bacterium]
MKVEWLGHSSFKLTESTGISLITDPFDAEKVGISYPEVSADYVTVSHKHFDHDAVENIKGYKAVIDMPGVHDLCGVTVYGLMSYHDHKKGALRGRNIIYKIRMDGVEVCHLGDIGEDLSPMLAELIGSINVLMVPVGGRYTVNARQAKEYVDMLMPDVVIPMHYMAEGYHTVLDDLDDFLKLFEEENIEYTGKVMEFDRTDFDGERTKIIIPKRVSQ